MIHNLDKIDKRAQVPLMILTTAGYLIVFLGFWQGAILAFLSQPLWIFTSWYHKQMGIFAVSIIILLGSLVCILKGIFHWSF